MQVVYQAEWVNGFGVFFCLLNIVLFLINCVLLSMRFYLRPGSLTKSFTDQVESLFIPAFVSLMSLNLISRHLLNLSMANLSFDSLSRK